MQLASPSVRFKRHSSFHAVSIVGASFAACTDTSFCSTASFEKVCMFVRVNKEAVRSVLTHSQMKAAALLLGCVCVCVCVTESKLCGVHSPSVRYKRHHWIQIASYLWGRECRFVCIWPVRARHDASFCSSVT
jgi:hypothetical protein